MSIILVHCVVICFMATVVVIEGVVTSLEKRKHNAFHYNIQHKRNVISIIYIILYGWSGVKKIKMLISFLASYKELWTYKISKFAKKKPI